jgi:hypothetical protein
VNEGQGNSGLPGCHSCWPESAASAWDARQKLARDGDLVDESHFHVMKLRCEACHQRFVSIFAEMIDWDDGDDSQHWTLIPVSEEELAALAARSPESLEAGLNGLDAARRSLIYDHPTGKKPSVFWSAGVRVPMHD